MDYKELSDMCRYLSDTPSYTAFHDEVEREIICDSCNGGFCYDKVKDAHWCMYEALQRASVAITELIERAEKAEKQRDKAVKTIETIMGCQKFCALCGNNECKNSNTRDASCNPIWNGLEE